MHVESRVPLQPALYLRVFMGRVIVGDQVDVESFVNIGID